MGRNKKDRSVQRWILRSVRPDWYGLSLLAFLRAVQAVLLTLIPSLIIFLFFHKQVHAGLASGSVKG